MPANQHDRNILIEQLAWQHGAGIDEVLLDIPAPEDSLSMSDLMSPSSTRTGLTPSPSASGKVDEGPAEGAAGSRSKPPEPSSLVPSQQSGVGPAGTLSGQPGSHAPDQTAALAAVNSLADLRAALSTLDGCALRHTASNLIFSDGNPGASLMVIGDVPGRDEDRVGLPLVGPEGQLFDRMLASIGLSRADVYIAPLIPWRPPGNRTPTDEEMSLLLPWLNRHIQLAAPRLLLVLGGVPAKAILPASGGILKLRGRWHDMDYGDGVPRPTLATLHPSYLIRSPAQKRLAYADLVALTDKLGYGAVPVKG